jgi:hypothetical protein
MPVHKALLCLFAAVALPAATAWAAEPAVGQAAARTQNQPAKAYRIDAGPLSSVLGRFAAAAGVALSFDPASTRTLSSSGIQGSYTVHAGFAALLAGTGLEAVEGGVGEFTLRKAVPAPQAAASSGEPDTDADGTLPAVRVVARAAPAPSDADDRYQPTPDASTLRTTAPVLDIPQVVNVVPAQVIRDQRPRNIDDALNNVSGITQGNTLASTQDTIMKRGFGGNRDGSIMHNGMPLVQGPRHERSGRKRRGAKGPVFAAVRDHGPGWRDQRGQQEAATAPAHGGVAARVGLRPRPHRHRRHARHHRPHRRRRPGLPADRRSRRRRLLAQLRHAPRDPRCAIARLGMATTHRPVLWYEYRKYVTPLRPWHPRSTPRHPSVR